MARWSSIYAALLASVAVLVGCATTNRALASEPKIAGIQVTSSDATARFLALGVSKSVVIDLPTDIKDVLVADGGIVGVVVRTNRRVYVIGLALGQTNVFLFDADGRQIGALDVAVRPTSLPPELENYEFPANVVEVYRSGLGGESIMCTPILCVDANKPGANQVPGTQNINVTGNTSAVIAAPK